VWSCEVLASGSWGSEAEGEAFCGQVLYPRLVSYFGWASRELRAREYIQTVPNM
jgi:hypothetical protein